jgi:hypothetical protein
MPGTDHDRQLGPVRRGANASNRLASIVHNLGPLTLLKIIYYYKNQRRSNRFLSRRDFERLGLFASAINLVRTKVLAVSLTGRV